MRRTALVLSSLYLFGVYALPGKVCPSSHGAKDQPAALAETNLPPCHQKASTKPADKPTPCETMVCCLVPDAARGTSSDISLPAPGGFSLAALPTIFAASAPVLSRPEIFEAQAPPGRSILRPASSPRAPPTLA